MEMRAKVEEGRLPESTDMSPRENAGEETVAESKVEKTIKAESKGTEKNVKAEMTGASQGTGETSDRPNAGTASEKWERSESQETAEDQETAEKREESESQEPDQPVERRHVRKKVFLAVLLTVLLLAAGYFGPVVYYRSHFFPNTSIDGISCGNMEISEVVPLIDAQLKQYSLTVTGRDYRTGEPGAVLGEIRAEDVSMIFEDTPGAVAEVFAQQNALLWPQAVLPNRRHFGYSLVQGVRFDSGQLRLTVSTWDACREKNMIEPTDAYISEYREELNGYEIIPETEGTELDLEFVFQCLEDSLYKHDSYIDLEEMQCYASPGRVRTDKKLTDAVETANKWLGARVVYDWNESEVILDSTLLREWITLETEEPVLDEEAVKKFVKEQAKKHDTYGKRKNFVTALGVTLKLRSPNYGWKTDVDTETAELIQLIWQGQQTEREPVYSVKAAQKGANDVGSSYVEADLTHQHLYVYENGEVVLETDFVSGRMNSTPGAVTPEGIYGLTYKTTKAVLRGADYETPVDYWMPFYGNYGMHDAQWRRNFGGTIYMEHGSHGCINLPLEAAAAIYNYVHTGSPVICYYYEVDPLAPSDPTTLTEEELLSQEEPTLGQQAEQDQQGQ